MPWVRAPQGTRGRARTRRLARVGALGDARGVCIPRRFARVGARGVVRALVVCGARTSVCDPRRLARHDEEAPWPVCASWRRLAPVGAGWRQSIGAGQFAPASWRQLEPVGAGWRRLAPANWRRPVRAGQLAPVIQAAQAQATSYTRSASTGNELHWQRKHRQPVIPAALAQATSYTDGASYIRNASTGNQLCTQRQHRQPVIQAATAQATSYTGSASTGNQLYNQRNHRQTLKALIGFLKYIFGVDAGVILDEANSETSVNPIAC